MAFVIQYNAGGNWTALFCVSAEMPQPPTIERSEHLYRWPHSTGYDGAYYHLLAHDPFLTRGYTAFIDAPRLRARRILLPLIAWSLAAGNDRAVHATYVAAIVAFIWAGVFWLSKHAVAAGLNAWWGLFYLLIPSTIISADRMLTDLPLVTLLIGCIWYLRSDEFAHVWMIAALACLCRETGICIVVGCAAWFLIRRRFAKSATMLAAAAPLALWTAYVNAHTPAGAGLLATWVGPFGNFASAVVRLRQYPAPALVQDAVRLLDEIALAGFVIGFAMACRFSRRDAQLACLAVPFLALCALLTSMNDVFTDVYGYGRLFSPVLALIVLDGFKRRSWSSIVPALLIDARVLVIPLAETARAVARIVRL